MQRPTRVPSRGLAGLGLAVDASPAAHDALDVLRRAGAADRQQALFRLGRGHAGQRPDLGVGELAARERRRQLRQLLQRACHADALARRAHVEAHTPGEPVGARAEAVVPAVAGVELADEIEEARGGGLEVHGELRDLVAELVERAWRHGGPPELVGLYTSGFRGAWRARGGAIATVRGFSGWRVDVALAGCCGALRRRVGLSRTRGRCVFRKLSSGNRETIVLAGVEPFGVGSVALIDLRPGRVMPPRVGCCGGRTTPVTLPSTDGRDNAHLPLQLTACPQEVVMDREQSQ